jgi:hypothetical protein
MPNELPPAFMDAAGLAKRIRVSRRTVNRRIDAGVIAPDAVLLGSPIRRESVLFLVDRLSDLRRAVVGEAKTHEPIQ